MIEALIPKHSPRNIDNPLKYYKTRAGSPRKADIIICFAHPHDNQITPCIIWMINHTHHFNEQKKAISA